MDPIAFFSMEYALSDDGPAFAGGLGVLAVDYLMEAGKQGLPLYAFGLFYHNQPREAEKWETLTEANGAPLTLTICLADRNLLLAVRTKKFGSAQLLLLDTDLPANPPSDREIVRSPYGPDHWNMIVQQLVLGLGSIELLKALKLTPAVYHLNEGHTSFVILARLLDKLNGDCAIRPHAVLDTLKPEIVATKHTILPAAGLFLPKDQLEKAYTLCAEGKPCHFDEFYALGTDPTHPDSFSTTKFLLEFSARANAVSQLHAKFEASVHPGSPLFGITNGINPERWEAENIKDSLSLTGDPPGRDKAGQAPSPRGQDPQSKSTELTDQDFWRLHNENRAKLINFINQETNGNLNPDALTIVWARRFATYKHPEILLSDPKRLLDIVNNPKYPIQFIVAGKINLADLAAAENARRFTNVTSDPLFKNKIAFLPNYSLSIAKTLTAGADIWLNTPEVGKEACGTSGMKAGLNGALEMSTSDGWIGEVDLENLGWVLASGETANSLYEVLEKSVAPMFYSRDPENLPVAWVQRMQATRKLILDRFTTKRMLDDYLNKLYFPK